MSFKNEVRETFKYIAIGLILAVFMNYGLGYALGAEKPVMAVMSDSMEPTLERGDLVVVKGVEGGKIDSGDIVVYRSPFKRIAVVHRVIDVENHNGKRYFITKGDNDETNPLSDQEVGIAPPLTEEDIKGEVVFSIPKVGLVKVWFTRLVTELGIFNAVLLLLLGLIALGMLENLFKKKRRDRAAEND